MDWFLDWFLSRLTRSVGLAVQIANYSTCKAGDETCSVAEHLPDLSRGTAGDAAGNTPNGRTSPANLARNYLRSLLDLLGGFLELFASSTSFGGCIRADATELILNTTGILDSSVANGLGKRAEYGSWVLWIGARIAGRLDGLRGQGVQLLREVLEQLLHGDVKGV